MVVVSDMIASSVCEIVLVSADSNSLSATAVCVRAIPEWLDFYFERINLEMPSILNAKTLAQIHFAHVSSIAYDMLDVFLGITPSFDMDDVRAKLISGRRGGGCTQLNGLLAVVLETLGFSLRRTLSAVCRESSGVKLSTHMVLLVRADNEEWICDTGFGYRGFLYPLRLRDEEQVVQGVHEYRLQLIEPLMWSICYRRGDRWINMYLLREANYETPEFVVGQFFNAYSPLSPFKSNLVCAKPSLDGGSYLVNGLLVSDRNGVRTRRIVKSLQEFVEVLVEYFDIRVSAEQFIALPEGLFDVFNED